MSLAQGAVKILRLHQSSSALAKSVTINVGFRPAMAWVMDYKAAGDMALAIDGETGPAGGVKFGAGAAMAAVGTDGITFHDKGIVIGQDTDIMKIASAEIIVILFRDINPIPAFALANVPVTPTAFGKGTQFKEAATTLGEVSVTKAS